MEIQDTYNRVISKVLSTRRVEPIDNETLNWHHDQNRKLPKQKKAKAVKRVTEIDCFFWLFFFFLFDRSERRPKKR